MKARRDAISSEIGAFKRKKAKTESDFTKHQNNLEVQDILNRYLQTIANVSDVSLYVKKGSGRRAQGSENINSQKRNAYKISGSAYGNLSVDVPKLKNEMKLNVFAGEKSFIKLMRINPLLICSPKDQSATQLFDECSENFQ